MISNKSKVLVVDDFAVIRTFQCNILNELGFQFIEEAGNGEDAQKKLLEAEARGAPFHLVLSDWNMPIMTGIDLLKFCRQNNNLKNIVFILVTAESEQVQVTEANKLGTDDYIVKPFSKDQFANKIFQINSRRKAKAA